MIYPENEIKLLAKAIKLKVKDGRLFGIKIDPNNPDHLIVAAYCLSQNGRDRELECWRKLVEFDTDFDGAGVS